MLFYIIVIIAYFFLGFLGYGISKGSLKMLCLEDPDEKYGKSDETLCLMIGIAGLFGFLIAICTAAAKGKFDFCLSMPKELREKQRGKE